MTKPCLAVGSLGGTITMTRDDGDGRGVTPSLTVADLLAAVPGLANSTELLTRTLATAPGASLGFAEVLAAMDWARQAVDDGAAAAVLVQGTDTLEETSYLLDLHWDREQPLVLTGAMRSPRQPGADGPANILAASAVATAPSSRGLGVLVTINDEVHAARRVRKSDATAPDAFTSAPFGPLARIHEGAVVYANRPRRWAALPRPTGTHVPRVALLEASLGDDGALLEAVCDAGYDGVVLSAFGAGHVSATMAEAVSAAVEHVPVLLTSRTGSGSVLSRTYGFTGSEQDLLARGVVSAGWLDAHKARILLWSLIATGSPLRRIREVVAARGGHPGGPGSDLDSTMDRWRKRDSQ
jgi:L-asparaginase